MAKAFRPKRARRGSRPDTPNGRAILEAAGRLLVEEGPGALTMRRLATASGTSTMVLYTRFGSREGVMEALLAEGFARFADALGAVSEADPVKHLRALGQAYRRFGLENPTTYRLMWANAPGGDWRQLNASKAAPHGQRAFGALTLGVTRVLAAMDRSAREAEPLAMAIWSAVHGFVSLELSGCLPPAAPAEQLYARTLDFVVAGLTAPSP